MMMKRNEEKEEEDPRKAPPIGSGLFTRSGPLSFVFFSSIFVCVCVCVRVRFFVSSGFWLLKVRVKKPNKKWNQNKKNPDDFFVCCCCRRRSDAAVVAVVAAVVVVAVVVVVDAVFLFPSWFTMAAGRQRNAHLYGGAADNGRRKFGRSLPAAFSSSF